MILIVPLVIKDKYRLVYTTYMVTRYGNDNTDHSAPYSPLSFNDGLISSFTVIDAC